MSRGHGALQRQILVLLEKHPEGAPPLQGDGLPGEWTAREIYHAIYWHDGSDAGEDRRAGRPLSTAPLQEAWETIARALLG